MNIILDSYQIPEHGEIELNINHSFTINITAVEAQKQVNRWLRNEISYLISALPPTLVVGKQVVWRVAASLGLPHLGQVGTVGTIDVNVNTGAMNNTAEQKAKIEHQAEILAARLPPYQPHSKVPENYLAKNVSPAPKIVLSKENSELLITENL